MQFDVASFFFVLIFFIFSSFRHKLILNSVLG